jgi:2-polyprenyl-3-methyl-5-hydroxy-6-metoxy-1,4-benzoquinol methylase
MNPFIRFLKFLRRMVNKLGIDIHLVEKKHHESAIHLNSELISNINWKDPRKVKKYLTKERVEFFEEIARILQINSIDIKDKPVADVGCGSGALFHILAEKLHGKNFVGFDFSEESLKVAEKIFPGAKYVHYNIYDSYQANFYLTLCTEVIEHLMDPEIALKNLMAMTADNGWLLITVPDGRKDQFEGHINFWSPESWERFIQKNADNCRYSCGKIGKQNLYALLQKPPFST